MLIVAITNGRTVTSCKELSCTCSEFYTSISQIVSGKKNSGGACSQTLPWPDRFKIASSGPVNTCMCAFVCVQRASSLTKKSQYIRAACALFHYCFT